MIYYVYKHLADENQLDNIDLPKLKFLYTMMQHCDSCSVDLVGVWEFFDVDVICGSFYDNYTLSREVWNDEGPLGGFKTYEDNKNNGFFRYEFYEQPIKKKQDLKWIVNGYNKLKPTDKFSIDYLLDNSAHIAKYREEVISFANIEKCPICGKEIKRNKKIFTNINGLYFIAKSYTAKRTVHNGIGKGERTEKYIAKEYLRGLGVEFVPSEEDLQADKYYEIYRKHPTVGDEVTTKVGKGIVTKYNENESAKIEYYDKCSLESMLNFFQTLYEKQSQKGIELFDAFVKTYDDNSQNNLQISNNSTIDSVENLKSYLLNAFAIEKNIYSVGERLKALYCAQQVAASDAMVSEKIVLRYATDELQKRKYEYEEHLKIDPCSDLKLEDFPVEYPLEPNPPTKPNYPILEKPGLFNRKRVLANNEKLLADYERNLSAYDKQFLEYTLNVEKYHKTLERLQKNQKEQYEIKICELKAQHSAKEDELKLKYSQALEELNKLKSDDEIVTTQKLQKSVIDDEIRIAEDLMIKLFSARKKIYAHNIIFEKYRNLVAVSIFYEYLLSGRCDKLEGVDGAYNIYESEIRLNTIVFQIEKVLESLEQIKNNQYLTYSAISETNRQLASLNASMEIAIKSIEAVGSTVSKIHTNTNEMVSHLSTIAENTEIIAYNTERSAFYAKKNAELSNALGYLVALN